MCWLWGLVLARFRDTNLSTILGVRPQTLPAMSTRLKCSSRIFGSEDQNLSLPAVPPFLFNRMHVVHSPGNFQDRDTLIEQSENNKSGYN